MISELLKEYKMINETIIININNDLEVDYLLKKKEVLIKELVESKKYFLEEVKEKFVKMELEESDKKLKETIDERLKEVRDEISNFNNRRSASNAYNQNKNMNNFFERKI
jgi:hypothetical protein